MTKPSLSKDTFIYTVMFWGQRLANLIVAPIAISHFTPKDYGYFSLVTLCANFLLILGTLAVLDQGLPRFFWDAKDDLEQKQYVLSSIVVSLSGITALILIVFLSAPFISQLFPDVDSPILFVKIIMLTLVAQYYFYAGNILLRWSLKSVRVLIINFFKTGLTAILTAVGILCLGWKATETLICLSLVTLSAGFWAHLSNRQFFSVTKFSWPKTAELLSFSWPLLGLNVFAFFSQSLSSFFLVKLSNLSSLGIYSVSNLMASVFTTVTAGFFWAQGPYVMATYKESWAPQKYAEYFSLITVFGIICIVGLGLWGADIVRLFRPDRTYQDIGVYIPWILTGTVLYYLGAYFAQGPYIMKANHWSLIAFLISSFLNCVLSLLLIPKWNILGAGMAVTLSSLTAAIFLQIKSYQLFPVPNKWKLSFSLIILLTLALSIGQMESAGGMLNRLSFVQRSAFTILFWSIGIVPFYQDIKQSGILRKFKSQFNKLFSARRH
jgi:O-antigen/teichoic acid export membrane protein